MAGKAQTGLDIFNGQVGQLFEDFLLGQAIGEQVSYSYAPVGNEIQALLDGMGFDPYVGFYHQVDDGRLSVALDLLEEFRPALVDRFSVKLLNLRLLRPSDFRGDAQRGVCLGAEGKKKSLRADEKELTRPVSVGREQVSFRRLFQLQAERLARTVRGERPYRSFLLPC